MIRMAIRFLGAVLILAAGSAALAAPVIHAGERELVTLSDADVRNAIAAITELRGLAEGKEKGSAGENTAAVLARHGFTEKHFADVGYSIGIALAALRRDPEDLAKSTEQQAALMKEMQARLPAEQRGRMEQALRALDQMRGQPKSNLDLVKRYQSELEGVLNE